MAESGVGRVVYTSVLGLVCGGKWCWESGLHLCVRSGLWRKVVLGEWSTPLC